MGASQEEILQMQRGRSHVQAPRGPHPEQLWSGILLGGAPCSSHTQMSPAVHLPSVLLADGIQARHSHSAARKSGTVVEKQISEADLDRNKVLFPSFMFLFPTGITGSVLGSNRHILTTRCCSGHGDAGVSHCPISPSALGSVPVAAVPSVGPEPV